VAEPLEALDRVRMTAIDPAMNFGPKVLVAAVILVMGYFAGQWAGRARLGLVMRLQLEPPVRRLLERIAIFVSPWVNVPGYGPAIGEVNQAVPAALRGRNIAIAAPQRKMRTPPPGA